MKKLEATTLVTCGHSTRLECRASGSPVITFKWFKDEMEISPGPKYSMAVDHLVASLEIDQCSLEEGGDYVCVASSEAGSDRCSGTVTVKGWFDVTHLSLTPLLRRWTCYCSLMPLVFKGFLIIVWGSLHTDGFRQKNPSITNFHFPFSYGPFIS